MLQHSKSCARVPSGAVQCANELSDPAAAVLLLPWLAADHDLITGAQQPAAANWQPVAQGAAIAQGAAHTEHRGSTPADTSKLLTSRIMSTGVSAVATIGLARRGTAG